MDEWTRTHTCTSRPTPSERVSFTKRGRAERAGPAVQGASPRPPCPICGGGRRHSGAGIPTGASGGASTSSSSRAFAGGQGAEGPLWPACLPRPPSSAGQLPPETGFEMNEEFLLFPVYREKRWPPRSYSRSQRKCLMTSRNFYI